MTSRQQRQAEIDRLSFQVAMARKPVTRPLQEERTKPTSSMSGRRLRTFKDSVTELELLMTEGDVTPDGRVLGRWGIPQ